MWLQLVNDSPMKLLLEKYQSEHVDQFISHKYYLHINCDMGEVCSTYIGIIPTKIILTLIRRIWVIYSSILILLFFNVEIIRYLL